MPKTRVMIVDDAAVFRRVVAEELSKDPTLEVVATAANGRIALARMLQVKPDIVILDVEMPELDGIATLAELRKTYPRLPVIMFSALTERGAEATLNALALGASDYFTKPASSEGLDASLAVIREQLIPEIKALCQPKSGWHEGAKTFPSAGLKACHPAEAGKTQPRQPADVQVLAMASSTGGPNALAEVFRGLPAEFPVPIVMVQHMPPMFTRLLAERLSHEFPLRFQEAATGCTLQAGQAWIAPGNYHMEVVPSGTQVRVQLHQEAPENSCRPAADVLLRSVARVFGPHALAVVLTGMGQDGLRGCEAIHEAGGQILAQDEATSVVWGMPGYVARAGLADRVLPLSAIAKEIMERVAP
jgi:two-component system chemotaxis response regulator CheB